jgi:predicted ATPase
MWNLGYPAQAAKLIRESESPGGELSDPFNAVMVVDYISMVHLVSKDAPAARRYADAVANLSTQYGFAGELAVANIVRGWTSGWGGDLRGLDLLRESFVAFVAAEGELTHSWICAMIAELCLKFGRHDEAVAALEEALAYKARTGEGFAEAEIYRLKGEAELRAGRSHFGIAAELFQQAIDAARKRSARMAELRATANLARLLCKQGRREEARTILAEIYNWFTEGFDTADLKDANALLEELKS